MLFTPGTVFCLLIIEFLEGFQEFLCGLVVLGPQRGHQNVGIIENQGMVLGMLLGQLVYAFPPVAQLDT